jgi:hypothetical protein
LLAPIQPIVRDADGVGWSSVPGRSPMPVYAATIPPTIAAIVSTSPPASTHAVIAAGKSSR